MTRDEVKQMARDSGMFGGVPEMEGATISERIERFAHLVEQRTREECARICEEFREIQPSYKDYENNYIDGWIDACNETLWKITSTLQASKVEGR